MSSSLDISTIPEEGSTAFWVYETLKFNKLIYVGSYILSLITSRNDKGRLAKTPYANRVYPPGPTNHGHRFGGQYRYSCGTMNPNSFIHSSQPQQNSLYFQSRLGLGQLLCI